MNRKGQFLSIFTVPILVTLIIGIVVILTASGFFLLFFKTILYKAIGAFLLVIAGVMGLRFGQVNKNNAGVYKAVLFLLVIFGVLLLFFPQFIEKLGNISLSIVNAVGG